MGVSGFNDYGQLVCDGDHTSLQCSKIKAAGGTYKVCLCDADRDDGCDSLAKFDQHVGFVTWYTPRKSRTTDLGGSVRYMRIQNGGRVAFHENPTPAAWDIYEIQAFHGVQKELPLTVVEASSFFVEQRALREAELGEELHDHDVQFPCNAVDGDLSTHWTANPYCSCLSAHSTFNTHDPQTQLPVGDQWIVLDTGSAEELTSLRLLQASHDARYSVMSVKVQYGSTRAEAEQATPTKYICEDARGWCTLFDHTADRADSKCVRQLGQERGAPSTPPSGGARRLLNSGIKKPQAFGTHRSNVGATAQGSKPQRRHPHRRLGAACVDPDSAQWNQCYCQAELDIFMLQLAPPVPIDAKCRPKQRDTLKIPCSIVLQSPALYRGRVLGVSTDPCQVIDQAWSDVFSAAACALSQSCDDVQVTEVSYVSMDGASHVCGGAQGGRYISCDLAETRPVWCGAASPNAVARDGDALSEYCPISSLAPRTHLCHD